MKKVSFLSALLVSNVASADLNLDYRAYNTPVNYNFAEVEVGHKTYKSDGNKDNMKVISIGSELMLNEKVIMKYSFSGEEINDVAKIISLNMGLLYRVALAEKIDVVLGGEVEFDWLALEGADTDTDYSYDNYDIGAHLGLRYGFTDKFEGVTQVIISDSSSHSLITTLVTTKLSYYVTKNIGVGAFYTAGFNDKFDSTYAGANIKVRF